MGGFFGMPGGGTYNNAPQPVPITGSVGTNTPSPMGSNSPSSGTNLGLLGSPTTPSANQSPFGSTSIQNLNSGITGGSNMPQLNYMLDKTYGSGTGSLLSSILSGGLFNPQIAQAMLGAMQPGINRGLSNIQQSFGAEGARFGSAAALGEGDYLSQVNLNEQSTLANMFQTSQGEELNLLQNLLPTIQHEKANSGGLLQDILGGLEIAGGIIGAPFTGGLSLGLTAAGVGTITGSGSGGGGSSGITGGLPGGTSPIFSGNSTSSQSQLDASSSGGYNSNNVANSNVLQTISAGQTLGGVDPFSTGNPNDPSDYSNLFPLLMGT